MSRTFWPLLIRTSIVLAWANMLALVVLLAEAVDQFAAIPERMWLTLLIGLFIVGLRYVHALVPFAPLFFYGFVALAFGLGMFIMNGCGFGAACRLWGDQFRIQPVGISALMLYVMINIALKAHAFDQDSLIRSFHWVILAFVLCFPLLPILLGYSLDDPVVSSRLILYTGLSFLGFIIALVMSNLTSHVTDPQPAQTMLHGLISIGGLVILGLVVALILSSEVRSAISSVLQFVVFAVTALVGLIIGILSIPFQWFFGDPTQISAERPTPQPFGPSFLENLSSSLNEPQPAANPNIFYIIQACIVLLILILLLAVFRAFIRRLQAAKAVLPDLTNRESIWSWSSFGEELADLLPHFKRSTAQAATTPNRQRIRQLYRRMLARAQRHNLERNPSTTPRAFSQTLKTQLNPQAVEQLTSLYEQARYGPEPHSADVAAATKAFEELEDS